MKLIIIDFPDRIVYVDKSKIADIEAKRRNAIDGTDEYQEEFDYLMEDDYEVIDYMVNSMDWKDIEPFVIDIIKKDIETKALWNTGAERNIYEYLRS